MKDKQTPPINPCHKEWTAKELDTLRREGHKGASHVATLLGRSVQSVRAMAKRNRISLRRQGERRGLILGQPRGVNWNELRAHGITPQSLKAIKADALAGIISMTELEARIARLAGGDQPPICPMCAIRPQEHQSGICRPCHLKALADAHRDARDTYEAQQRLWAARQESSRARRRAAKAQAED